MAEERVVIFDERKYKRGVKLVISSLSTVPNTLYWHHKFNGPLQLWLMCWWLCFLLLNHGDKFIFTRTDTSY